MEDLFFSKDLFLLCDFKELFKLFKEVEFLVFFVL